MLPIDPLIPLWIKLLYTLMVLLVVPVYLKHYPITNFLWFSDVALLGLVPALWLESSLLASMLTVGILLPEVAWNIDFFGRLFTGKKLLGIADYFFEGDKPRFVRLLTLFHVPLPVVMLYLLHQLGYHERALLYMTGLGWFILLLSYFASPPEENTNWVFGPGARPQQKLPRLVYFTIVMLAYPLCLFLPTHFLLKWWFG